MSEQPVMVILAAGASVRLGQPKALVELHGSTPLEHLQRAWRTAAGTPADSIVVTGADHAPIAAAFGSQMELLYNPRWSAGRTGGLALAAERWPGRDLLVAPVDCPLVPAEVFSTLLLKWKELSAPDWGFLTPWVQFEGRPKRFGHPIIVGNEMVAQLPGFDPATPLRDLRGEATPQAGVGLSNREILDNLDTPAALEELQGRAPNRTSDELH